MKISIPLHRFNPLNLTEDDFDENPPVSVITMISWLIFIILGSISFITWNVSPEAIRALYLFATLATVGTFILSPKRKELEE